jgi:hypothetical protein
MSSHEHKSDRSAAYTGLIGGAIALFVMVYTIVHLTESHYAKAEGAKSAASAAK